MELSCIILSIAVSSKQTFMKLIVEHPVTGSQGQCQGLDGLLNVQSYQFEMLRQSIGSIVTQQVCPIIKQYRSPLSPF